MLLSRVVLALFSHFIISVYADPASSAFENAGIVRTIDLGGSLVHVTTTYAAKALEQGVDLYTVALSKEEHSKTSWLEVKIKGQTSLLPISDHTPVDPSSKYRLLDVHLPKKLDLGATVNIVLETVQTHVTWPWPEFATQEDDQAMKYATDLFIISPYNTAIQRSKFKSSSPKIIEYTTPKDVDHYIGENSVTQTGATVTYGPYNNIPPLTDEFMDKEQQSVTIHYNYDYPVIEVADLVREAEVSHWGANLNIQDTMSLHNAGPTLKGHFSRVQYQSQTHFHQLPPHIIPSLALHLPPGIQNTYYLDQIGNVTTSNLRTVPSIPKNSKSNQYSLLEFRPRYPILGGWNYSFTLGWDSPLGDSASYDKASGKYIVEVPIMTVIPGAVVSNAEMRITLPEGATDIEYSTPFKPMGSYISRTYTYLDTIGRPTLVFEYKNLTDKHAQSILVTYKVPLMAHLQKPFAVSVAFFTVFFLTTLARRVSLQITPKQKQT